LLFGFCSIIHLWASKGLESKVSDTNTSLPAARVDQRGYHG
jgi:hypothetical protein